MKLPIVSRKKYESALEQIEYWRERGEYVLTIPVLEIDGIGQIKIYGSKKQIDMIQKRLKVSYEK